MLEDFRDNTAPLGSKKLEKNPALLPRGIFREEQSPEYCEEYARLVDRAMRE